MTDFQGEEVWQMDMATYRRFIALVKERSGLAYDDSSKGLFERRFSPRVNEAGLPSFAQYVELLKTSDSEMDYVFDILTTKETYFFRQEYQLSTFVKEVVPILKGQGGLQNRITVWSAGCSTGEEAYTLAILLSSHPDLQHTKVRVIGTDLCRSNIVAAERGIYRPTSFRSTTDDQLVKHFTETASGFQVNADIRRMVHFSRVNLVNSEAVRGVGRVDAIFCRNVLIYFDQAARQAATKLFYERLLPGGFLMLGHSESLLNTTTRFEPVHLEGDLVYQRPLLDGSSQSKIKV